MDLPRHLEVRPDVMMGKVCLRGTRIPAALILEKLAAGESAEVIMGAYPQVSRDHIAATLQYAASLANDEIILAS